MTGDDTRDDDRRHDGCESKQDDSCRFRSDGRQNLIDPDDG